MEKTAPARTRKARKVRNLLNALCWFAILVVALAVVLVFLTRTLPPPGTAESTTFFDYEESLTIEVDGHRVNNSPAVFSLDVLPPDAHSEPIFANFAEALAYCREHELPVLPSFHLVHAKLKASQDHALLALRLGEFGARKQRVLRRLAEALHDGPLAEHVATAITLGEGETPNSELGTPRGLWAESDAARNAWHQDRFLGHGLWATRKQPSKAQWNSVVAASNLLQDQPELRAALAAVNAIESAIHDRPRSVLLADLADAEFANLPHVAITAFARSPQDAVLARISGQHEFVPNVELIDSLREGIASGNLDLTPPDDAGWYGRQWFALETLLRPELAHEAAKLRMSSRYQWRLEQAFAAAVAGDRHSHLNIMIVEYLGGGASDALRPQFAVEPLATVYLRWARAYQRLLADLSSVLPESELAAFRELRNLCLGLCEVLAPQLGLLPDYAPGEFSDAERVAARQQASQWLASLQSDPVLAEDRRVATPIYSYPGGQAFWGLFGVYLERIELDYEEPPHMISDVGAMPASAESLSRVVYAATDCVAEFHLPSEKHLSDEAFRKRCETWSTVSAWRTAFDVQEAPPDPERWSWAWWLLLLPVLGVGIWLRRKGHGEQLLWACGAASLTMMLTLLFAPRFIMPTLANNLLVTDEALAAWWVDRLTRELPVTWQVSTYTGWLEDSNPDLRELAAVSLWVVTDYHREDLLSNRAFCEALGGCLTDSNLKVAMTAASILGGSTHPEDLARIRAVMAGDLHGKVRTVCLWELGVTDPRASDFRDYVRQPELRRPALVGLARSAPEEVIAELLFLIDAGDPAAQEDAWCAVTVEESVWPWVAECADAALRNSQLSMRLRFDLLWRFDEDQRNRAKVVLGDALLAEGADADTLAEVIDDSASKLNGKDPVVRDFLLRMAPHLPEHMYRQVRSMALYHDPERGAEALKAVLPTAAGREQIIKQMRDDDPDLREIAWFAVIEAAAVIDFAEFAELLFRDTEASAYIQFKVFDALPSDARTRGAVHLRETLLARGVAPEHVELELQDRPSDSD